MAEESLRSCCGISAREDLAALDRLIPMVYAELRRLAANCLRQERTGHTLQPTALVHECYMRLLAQQPPDYQSRAHFYGVAAQVMRRDPGGSCAHAERSQEGRGQREAIARRGLAL